MEGTVQCCYLDMLREYNICFELTPYVPSLKASIACCKAVDCFLVESSSHS
jgi:hypothetical protein